MKNLLKITLLASVSVTLAACKTTESFYMVGVDESTAQAVKYKREYEFKNINKAKINDATEFDIVIDGITYTVKGKGKDERGRETYDNSDDADREIDLTLARSSFDRLQNSAVYRVYQNPLGEDETSQIGFVYWGEFTEDLPESGSVDYTGSIAASLNNKEDKSKWSFFIGDVDMKVDFKTSKLSGSTKDLGAITSEGGGFNDFAGNIKFSAGVAKNGVISATIKSDSKFDELTGQKSSLTGKLDARFFGKDAQELVGTGYYENDETIGALAIDLKK